MDDSAFSGKTTPSTSKLSKQFLKNLYETKCSASNTNPILQILAFEESLHEPHSEIIVRLSDGVVFIDCSLIGSYCINNGKIMSADSSQIQVEFMPKDLVKLTDFFSKIDNRRICELRIMILKMELAQKCQTRIGFPAELRQYFQNMKEGKPTSLQRENSKNFRNVSNGRAKKERHEVIKIQQNGNEVMRDEIEEDERKSREEKKENYQVKPKPERKSQQSLTYQQIIDGKEGFFLGRLLRMKMANKETKDGPMSVLYLGFIDRVGELVRINMAGRVAIKEQKQLKKGKCYYIKELETFKTEKMAFPQIRLKDKDYKIIEVQQPALTQKFMKYYFHWDHEYEHIQTDNVDIIGIIDDIEDKATYPSNEKRQSQKREVVRIVVRNKFKTVKINFWAEQIKIISQLKLKKKQAIVLQDIKKKKNIFLDFQYDSNIIKLDQSPSLKEQLKHFLPQSLDAINEPKNIKQLEEVYQEEGASNKVHTFKLFLSRMYDNRIIYKLCNYCKRKVEKLAETCQQCRKNDFYFKYNCQLQFADYSGSLCCVAFQYSAQKILGKTPKEISQMSADELNEMIQQFSFKEYEIGIQNRSCRFIVRNAELTDTGKHLVKASRDNIEEIKRLMGRNK